MERCPGSSPPQPASPGSDSPTRPGAARLRRAGGGRPRRPARLAGRGARSRPGADLAEPAGRAGARRPRRLRADEGLRARLLAVLGVSAALGDHLVRHPDHWSLLGRSRSASGGAPGRAAARGRRRAGRRPSPARDAAADTLVALRVAYRGRLLAPGRPRPHRAGPRCPRSPPSCPTSPAPRWRRAWPSRGPSSRTTDSVRLAVDRHGQVRRARAQLHQRRRRDLRGRAARAAPDETKALRSRHPAGPGHDAGLLGQHPRGVAVGGGRRRCGPRARPGRWCAPSPATWPTTGAGPRPGSSRRCSRPGRSRATSSSARQYVEPGQRAGLAGRHPRELRRGRAGHAPPGRGARRVGARPSASSSWGPAGCATSSSRCSCCSSCTAGSTRCCAAGPRCPRWPPCPGAATSAGTTPRRSPRRTPSCARSSTCSSCTGCAVPTWCPRTPPTCAGWAGRWGCRSTRWGSSPPSGGGTRRRRGACTRSCSTGRCCRRWPGCPTAEARLSTRGRRRPGWRRSATPTRPARCATSTR